MPRPHEDLERHTPVDHRSGGEPIEFTVGHWYAIEVAHVAAHRVGAAEAAYETLIEKARASSAKAQTAVIFRSLNNRRVIALVAIAGHDSFRHLASAWDDHHLTAQHRDVAESSELALYKFARADGDAIVDPASTDTYAFERVARAPERASALIAAASSAAGFRAALVFGSDDATASAIVYRFAHHEQIETFRASSAAVDILGPVSASGDTMYSVQPVKTFA